MLNLNYRKSEGIVLIFNGFLTFLLAKYFSDISTSFAMIIVLKFWLIQSMSYVRDRFEVAIYGSMIDWKGSWQFHLTLGIGESSQIIYSYLLHTRTLTMELCAYSHIIWPSSIVRSGNLKGS